MSRFAILQPRGVARYRKFWRDVIPDLKDLFNASLLKQLLQCFTRLKTKPGVDQPDAARRRLTDNRPNNLIGGAAQLPIEGSINVSKARHKGLFNTVNGQQRQIKCCRELPGDGAFTRCGNAVN